LSSGGLTVWEAFERVARRFPDRPALVEGAGSATYSELQARAEVLAGDLAARLGTGPRHVGLRFTGAAGLVLSSLAAARAGGVSVCLDVREPPERLSGVCADAGVSLVLTDGPVGIEGVDESLVDWEPGPSGAAPGAGETYPCWVAEGEERSQQLSCISYSSGSTGEPKGIMWTHAARLGMAERLGLLVYPDVRVCAFFAGSAGNSDMLAMSLLSGATLVPYPVARLGLAPLPAWLEANAVQGMGLVPTLLRHLLATLPEGCVLPVRKVALYGEGSLWEEVGQLLAHLPEDAQVVNTYGTMETAGGSRFFVDRSSPRGEGRLPAGSPSPGRDLMVAGPDGEALPPGQVGEVVVIGDDLPSGYWQRPSMTEERWRRTDDGEGVRAHLGLHGDGRLARRGLVVLCHHDDLVPLDAAGRVHLVDGDAEALHVALPEGRERPCERGHEPDRDRAAMA
jgi:non-ribosomal peptide synthetase component F